MAAVLVMNSCFELELEHEGQHTHFEPDMPNTHLGKKQVVSCNEIQVTCSQNALQALCTPSGG